MSRTIRVAKIAIYWLLAFLPLLLVLELSSYILLKKTIPTRISARVGEKDIEYYLDQRKQIVNSQPVVVNASKASEENNPQKGNVLRMFHPVLGWDYPPDIVYKDTDDVIYSHGPHGERKTCTSFENTLITTYGDSFTYCANVPDDCTWQTFLGQKLKQNVINFGVGGYGTDQAVLKHELHDKIFSRIVMLCILPENINRIVNIYRPFYTYNDPMRLTKPVFIGKDGQLTFVPNPLKSFKDIIKLDDPKFMMDLARNDYWYQLDQNLPNLSFPWMLSLFRWRDAVLKQITISLPGASNSFLQPRYPWNLFDEDYPFSVMCHLVDKFVANASARGTLPIIVIMPHIDYIQESLDYGVNRVERLVQYMTDKNYLFIDGVKLIAGMKPSRAKLEKMYHGHATAEGNKALADIVFGHLSELDL